MCEDTGTCVDGNDDVEHIPDEEEGSTPLISSSSNKASVASTLDDSEGIGDEEARVIDAAARALCSVFGEEVGEFKKSSYCDRSRVEVVYVGYMMGFCGGRRGNVKRDSRSDIVSVEHFNFQIFLLTLTNFLQVQSF